MQTLVDGIQHLGASPVVAARQLEHLAHHQGDRPVTVSEEAHRDPTVDHDGANESLALVQRTQLPEGQTPGHELRAKLRREVSGISAQTLQERCPAPGTAVVLVLPPLRGVKHESRRGRHQSAAPQAMQGKRLKTASSGNRSREFVAKCFVLVLAQVIRKEQPAVRVQTTLFQE